MIVRRQSAPWLVVAAVAALLGVYFPALGGGFIWDDDAHVTAPALRSVEGLARIWFEPGATQQYYPLLHSWFWLQHACWGDAPLGYHLVNVLLHAAAAALVCVLLRRLAVPGALGAALLFAFHPVQVESVAWISEQKNTLSAVLGLAAALAYLKFNDTRSRRAYLGATVLFVAALLAKTVTATLPAALLVIAWWRHGTIAWRRDVAPLVPWLIVGAAAGLHTAWLERHQIGADGAAFELGLGQRLQLAGQVGWFYLGKLLWPANLAFVYPRWEIGAAGWRNGLPLAALGTGLVLLWRIRARARGPLAAALLHLGLLFPVLGFFNVYPFQYSYVADHFQYLAGIPAFAAFAAAGAWMAERLRLDVAAVLGTGGLVVLSLGALTWRQAHDYRDNATLFRATLERNPGCWMAANNLAKELMATPARRPEAIALLERALALRPDYFEAHNNLGLVLAQSGHAAEAVPHAETAVRLKPGAYQAHNNLGIALAGSGRADEALAAFARATALAPRLPNLHDNWGKALLLLDRTAEAEERFTRAAELRAATSATAGSPP